MDYLSRLRFKIMAVGALVAIFIAPSLQAFGDRAKRAGVSVLNSAAPPVQLESAPNLAPRQSPGPRQNPGLPAPHPTPEPGPGPISSPSNFSLSPDVTANWQVTKTHPNSSLQQLSNGVRVTAYNVEGGPSVPGSVALWSKLPERGDWKVSYKLKVISQVGGIGSGSFVNFYFDVFGKGTAEYPTNMSQWPANVTPTDKNYWTGAQGLRFSHGNYNTLSPGNTGEIRLNYSRKYTGSKIKIADSGTDDGILFPFTVGKTYSVTITRQGTKLTITAKPDDNSSALITWTVTNSTLGKFGRKGHFGIMVAAKTISITNFTFTQL